MPDDQPLDPQAAAHIARVRRLMMIASATTFLALAVVLAVIGYRLFHLGGSAPAAPANLAAPLPAGAKVLSSAVGEGRIVLTVEIDGRDRIAQLRPQHPQAARASCGSRQP